MDDPLRKSHNHAEGIFETADIRIIQNGLDIVGNETVAQGIEIAQKNQTEKQDEIVDVFSQKISKLECFQFEFGNRKAVFFSNRTLLFGCYSHAGYLMLCLYCIILSKEKQRYASRKTLCFRNNFHQK